MKKLPFLTPIFLLLALALTACGGTATSIESTTDVSGTPGPGTDAAAGTLPEGMQLLIGIASLADSDTPLTAEQAATILPLWKAVRSLGESDTAAQVEIDALYTQIRGTLTEEQIAVADTVTAESMTTASQELGIDMGFGGRAADSPEAQATFEALRASGQMPSFEEGFEPPEGFEVPEGAERPEIPSGGDMPFGGGMAGGGGFPGGDTGMDPSLMATQRASGMNMPALNNTINTAWLDAIITMLEGIAGGQ